MQDNDNILLGGDTVWDSGKRRAGLTTEEVGGGGSVGSESSMDIKRKTLFVWLMEE